LELVPGGSFAAGGFLVGVVNGLVVIEGCPVVIVVVVVAVGRAVDAAFRRMYLEVIRLKINERKHSLEGNSPHTALHPHVPSLVSHRAAQSLLTRSELSPGGSFAAGELVIGSQMVMPPRKDICPVMDAPYGGGEGRGSGGRRQER
jgi:hypothetical protein